MAFKHAYMVITTNFELESVLDQFLATYPQNEFESYQVAFKTTDEHREGEYSYILVFNLHALPGREPKFYDFLQSYCTINNKVAVASVTNNIFPRLDRKFSSDGRVFGILEKKP